MQNSQPFPQKFSPKELAHHMRVTVLTLKHWRDRRIGPAYHREGLKIFYYLDEVMAWRESTKWREKR